LDAQGSGWCAKDPVLERKPAKSRDQGWTTMSSEDVHAFVPEKYREFEKVFIKSAIDSLPVHTSYDHAINLDELFIL
jgi:hypothetical protein